MAGDEKEKDLVKVAEESSLVSKKIYEFYLTFIIVIRLLHRNFSLLFYIYSVEARGEIHTRKI